MRIALRPSGGRGEYELTGRQGDVRSGELAEKRILFEIAPDTVVPGLCGMKRVQGKPRIRLTEHGKARHSHLLFSSILLLPRPKRELHKTGSSPVILEEGNYSIVGVDVDLAGQRASEVCLAPKALYAGNQSGKTKRIDFGSRMAAVHRLWSAAEKDRTEFGAMLRQHREAVLHSPENHRKIEAISDKIRGALVKGGDPLLQAFEKVEAQDQPRTLDIADLVVGEDEEEMGPEDDPQSPSESRKQQVQLWRKTIARGPAARRFSDQVKATYDFRCMFTGKRLPPTPETASTGVEAAHILPWAQHRIDEIGNGLCLDRLCHWAFDAGVMRLDWLEGRYVVTVPDPMQVAARASGFDIESFLALAGPLPTERLPADRSKWPKPDYLEKLNQELFG